MRVPPDFLDVEGDATADVDGAVFFTYPEALVVVEGWDEVQLSRTSSRPHYGRNCAISSSLPTLRRRGLRALASRASPPAACRPGARACRSRFRTGERPGGRTSQCR